MPCKKILPFCVQVLTGEKHWIWINTQPGERKEITSAGSPSGMACLDVAGGDQAAPVTSHPKDGAEGRGPPGCCINGHSKH